MSDRLKSGFVIEALRQAIGRRDPDPGCIFHSDRGVQYACEDFRAELKTNSFIQSMSRKGNCYDNAVAESFFHTLKTEHVYDYRYETRAEARQSIFVWIEMVYNRRRKHSALGNRPPVSFELMTLAASLNWVSETSGEDQSSPQMLEPINCFFNMVRLHNENDK